MARINPSHLPIHSLSFLPFSPAVFITILAILAVLSTVVFLCGAHRALTSTRDNNVEQNKKKKKKKNCVRLGGKKPARLHSSKTLLMAKLIAWRQVQDDEEEEEEDEDHDGDGDGDGDEQVIWKRTIIKGEKCRPLDFSGKILYDSNGNMIAAE